MPASSPEEVTDAVLTAGRVLVRAGIPRPLALVSRPADTAEIRTALRAPDPEDGPAAGVAPLLDPGGDLRPPPSGRNSLGVALPVVTPSPPVSVHQLLTGWQLGSWSDDVALALQVVAALLYVGGVSRLRRKGRAWPVARTAAFLSGLVVLVVAVDSGLASYDRSVFGVHVVQHLLLMMVAPPLLALGAPITLALQASGRRVQSRLARSLHHPVTVAVTTPVVAAVLYYVSMYADLSTSLYPYSLRHPVVHDASHLVMFWLGCLFWWPVVATDRLPRRPAFGLRLATLAVGMPFEAFLGISLLSRSQTLAPAHTVSDIRTGGGLFWVTAMMITFLAALVVLAQWMGQDERRSARPPGREERAREADWAAAWKSRTGSVPRTVAPGADAPWRPGRPAAPSPGGQPPPSPSAQPPAGQPR